jgi:hypothetical protein
MICYMESGGAINFTFPSGWVEVSNYQNASANMTSSIAYKVAGGSEPSTYTVTDDGGDGTPSCGMILTYRGVDTANPVNAHGESNTGTTGTSAVAAPTTTSTAPGWYVWFRAGKISTTNPTENDFNVTSGTSRQLTSNRGASTEYFIRAADSNGNKSVGSNSGATFTRTGSGTFSGSLARTIVLAEAVSGSFSSTLDNVVASGSGNVHDDATLASTLGRVSANWAGVHYIPATGTFASTLGHVSASFSVTSTGGAFSSQLKHVTANFTGGIVHGTFASSLSKVVADFAGDVNPIGSFSSQLSHVVAAWVAETRPFGAQVIFVEPEKRGLRIMQDETIPIYPSEVTQE